MLPQAHLTSHSRMSGSGWVITPSWLSGSWISFLYSSSMYSCHLFLISSASVRSIPSMSFIEPIFAWNLPLVSLLFLKRSLVFPILLFYSISLHWSLRKAFYYFLLFLCTDHWEKAFLARKPLSLLFFGTLHSDGYVFPFLLYLSPLFFSQPFLRPLQTTMATHCSVLAWRIPGTEEPSGLPSMGSHRVGQDWSDLAAAVGTEQ